MTSPAKVILAITKKFKKWHAYPCETNIGYIAYITYCDVSTHYFHKLFVRRDKQEMLFATSRKSRHKQFPVCQVSAIHILQALEIAETDDEFLELLKIEAGE